MRQRIGAALAALAMVVLPALPAAAAEPYPPGINADALRAATLSEGIVAAGGAQSCTITSLGDVYCWSDGPAVLTLRDAVHVDAGRSHACAVSGAGQVSCWGAGRAEPYEVPGFAGRVLVQVAAGDRHTCALDDEGAAWCWDAGSAAPARVGGIGATIVDIAAGGDTTCAATAGGEAYCWKVGREPAPAPGIDGKVREVAVGGTQACALNTDGRAVCWGRAPAEAGRVALDRISAGGDQLCGIDRTGLGRCWGADVELGALRDLDVGADRACAADSRGYVSCWGAEGVPVRVEGLPRPPGAATGVRVRALDGGLRVSWRSPADLGTGPFTLSWVTTADTGSGCVLREPAATGCEILGLRNGREYDVAVVVMTRDGLTISDYVTVAPSEVAPAPSGSAAPVTPPRELQPGEGGGLPVTGLSPVALVSIGTLLLGGGLVALLVRKPSSPAPRRGTAQPPA